MWTGESHGSHSCIKNYRQIRSEMRKRRMLFLTIELSNWISNTKSSALITECK